MYVMETKVCKSCNINKTVDQFEKDNKHIKKDGTVSIYYKPECKECRKGCRTEDKMRYRQNNIDKINEYRQKNIEHINAYKNAYRQKNIEHINAYNQEKINCTCGCTITRINLSRHKKSEKHNNSIN